MKRVLPILLILGIIILLLVNKPHEQLLYGVNVHSLTNYDSKSIEQLANLGGTLVRKDFTWGAIERQRGIYDFSYYDKSEAKGRQANVTTIAILGYTNGLYMNVPEEIIKYNANASNRWKNNYMPTDRAEFEIVKKAYGDYVYATVRYYKGKIKYFELYNEPYVKSFWYPEPNAVYFTELLKEGYIRAKQANPNAVIINNGATGGGISYVATTYQYGIKGYFDVLAIHPYCPPADPRNYTQCTAMKVVKETRKLMLQYGDDKPIWFTEMGYPTSNCDQTGTICRSNNTQEGQADYLKRTVEAIKTDMPYVKALIWYQFKDSCNINDTWSECNFGIVDSNLQPKPAYYEFQKIISEDKK